MTPNSKTGYGDITPEQERLLKLSVQCKNIDAFEFEGVKYLGNMSAACKQFCEETSYPADFHVWLQKNFKVIND